jgi:hypothetical protein
MLSSFGGGLRSGFSGFYLLMLVSPVIAASSLWRQQRLRVKALVPYLETQLKAEVAPAAGAEAESQEVTTRMVGMHLILNQLEQDLQLMLMRAMALPVALGSVSIMPLFMVVMLGLFGQSLDWRVLAAMLPLIAVPPVMFYGRQSRRRARLRRQLESSELALRLASGELKHDAIFDYVPWAMRWWLQFPRMPRAYADDLRLVLWRVATNLDWYLGPPRTLFRLAWVASLLLAMGTLLPVLLPFALMRSSNNPMFSSLSSGSGTAADSSTYLIILALLGIPLLLLTVVMLEYQRLKLGSEELVRYLRWRLAGAEQ